MELKVWCDGIKRVVCGVSPATTCQEVVFALAHATGQTGRFILIEKFRNQSERLLAPNEHPLLVLSHWGEYATDVQFVMRRSDQAIGTGAKTSGQPSAVLPNKSAPALIGGLMTGQAVVGQSQQLQPQSVSPNRSNSNNRDLFDNTVAMRKSGHRLVKSSDINSLPPSMAKQISSTPSTAVVNTNNRNGQTNSTSNANNNPTNSTITSTSIITNNSNNTHHNTSAPALTQNTTITTTTTTTSPIKHIHTNANSISSHNNTNNNNNNNLINTIYDNQDALLANHRNNSPYNHNNEPIYSQKFINHINNSNNNIMNSNMNDPDHQPIYQTMTGSPKTMASSGLNGQQHRPRHPPPYSEAINKSALITGTVGTGLTATGNAVNTSHSTKEFDSSLSSTPTSDADRSQPAATLQTNASIKRRSAEPSPQTQSKQRTSGGGGGGVGTGSPQKDHHLLHRDAVRLVDMQQETMRQQEKEMSGIEREISVIEKNLLDNELMIGDYKSEMEAVHQRWLDQEVVIDQMDQQDMERELDDLVDRAQQYELEVTKVKQKLSQCEGQIGDCRQQISRLMDQLEQGQAVHKAMASEAAQDETDRLADQLMCALRDKKDEFESQKNDLQTLTANIEQLDTALADKVTQVDRLLNDLKEANLHGLSLSSLSATGDDLSSHNNYCTNGGQRQAGAGGGAGGNGIAFQHRSGSTRRMIGSPRELENAAPTNKNPHGVWV